MPFPLAKIAFPLAKMACSFSTKMHFPLAKIAFSYSKKLCFHLAKIAFSFSKKLPFPVAKKCIVYDCYVENPTVPIIIIHLNLYLIHPNNIPVQVVGRRGS
jgi:hypothetical protein